jgi:hypothetical protein
MVVNFKQQLIHMFKECLETDVESFTKESKSIATKLDSDANNMLKPLKEATSENDFQNIKKETAGLLKEHFMNPRIQHIYTYQSKIAAEKEQKEKIIEDYILNINLDEIQQNKSKQSSSSTETSQNYANIVNINQENLGFQKESHEDRGLQTIIRNSSAKSHGFRSAQKFNKRAHSELSDDDDTNNIPTNSSRTVVDNSNTPFRTNKRISFAGDNRNIHDNRLHHDNRNYHDNRYFPDNRTPNYNRGEYRQNKWVRSGTNNTPTKYQKNDREGVRYP